MYRHCASSQDAAVARKPRLYRLRFIPVNMRLVHCAELRPFCASAYRTARLNRGKSIRSVHDAPIRRLHLANDARTSPSSLEMPRGAAGSKRQTTPSSSALVIRFPACSMLGIILAKSAEPCITQLTLPRSQTLPQGRCAIGERAGVGLGLARSESLGEEILTTISPRMERLGNGTETDRLL